MQINIFVRVCFETDWHLIVLSQWFLFLFSFSESNVIQTPPMSESKIWLQSFLEDDFEKGGERSRQEQCGSPYIYAFKNRLEEQLPEITFICVLRTR